jgi:hypothetical protein
MLHTETNCFTPDIVRRRAPTTVQAVREEIDDTARDPRF